MIKDIDENIDIINHSVEWADKYNQDSFPRSEMKTLRRELRKYRSSLSERCSAAAYGESQVGKSYLISSLLSSPEQPFVITNAGKEYSFIDDINPSGGQTAKTESTGVITRFTMSQKERNKPGLVRIKTLSVVDIVLMLADSYYNDVDIDPDRVIGINKELDSLSLVWNNAEKQQQYISEDDILDIRDYMHDVIGNNSSSVTQSDFFKRVGQKIQFIPSEKWGDVFSLLWNKNEGLTKLFCLLINEYKKFGFRTDIYVPFSAVLREKGSLLDVSWLNRTCGEVADSLSESPLVESDTEIYDSEGTLLLSAFGKSYLSALIAEITFYVPENLATEREFLQKIDLLDFPGARSREKIGENDVSLCLPKLLRRGKVAYLFNKYSRSLMISALLFCHHNDQKTVRELGENIGNWINTYIGDSPEKRAEELTKTNGISPFFFIATKFNEDLVRIKTDKPDTVELLTNHWKRFSAVIPELVDPASWLEKWTSSNGQTSAFKNIYLLRDFYWSCKKGLFEGYKDGLEKHEETALCVDSDYPRYMDDLKSSFFSNDFVKSHFANLENAWKSVTLPNNDGSKVIIENLNSIAGVLDDARNQKSLVALREIKKNLKSKLFQFFEPEDQVAKNERVRTISGDMRSFSISVTENPAAFGNVIDSLMVNSEDFRSVVYDILVRHTETPHDYSEVNTLRVLADINIKDSEETNIQRLCNYFRCQDRDELNARLKAKDISLNDILSDNTERPTTEAELVACRLFDCWALHLANQESCLQDVLHPQQLVFMLTALFKKLNVIQLVKEKVNHYIKLFANQQESRDNNLPNMIADYAALTFNNFVSNVGVTYLSDSDILDVKQKAETCGLCVDDFTNLKQEREPQSLADALAAQEKSSELVKENKIDKDVLQQLPWWNNYMRWINLLDIGLLFTSDISHCDPKANADLKVLLDECDPLYA